jgi:hypothetical protein
MAKKKRKAFRVLMVPEKGAPAEDENGRKFIRIHEAYAESEAGAREFATEQALDEARAYGTPVYVVKSVEPVKGT